MGRRRVSVKAKRDGVGISDISGSNDPRAGVFGSSGPLWGLRQCPQRVPGGKIALSRGSSILAARSGFRGHRRRPPACIRAAGPLRRLAAGHRRPPNAETPPFRGGVSLFQAVSGAFCRRRRVAGVLYPETRANLSRANFGVSDTHSCDGNAGVTHEHPVVLPHVSHFMQVPLRTSVKLPHSPHISPS
jgi:hypothetical protein